MQKRARALGVGLVGMGGKTKRKKARRVACPKKAASFRKKVRLKNGRRLIGKVGGRLREIVGRGIMVVEIIVSVGGGMTVTGSGRTAGEEDGIIVAVGAVVWGARVAGGVGGGSVVGGCQGEREAVVV